MAEQIYPVRRDGIDFEVRASSKEEAMQKAQAADLGATPRIIARSAGNTRVFERPNGQRYVVSPGFSSTDPKAVEKAMSGMTAGDISKQNIDEALIAAHPYAARAQELAWGTPFVGSYTDEALGAALGPRAALAARATSDAMHRQRPGQTLALNLGGGVLGTAAMIAAAPEAMATALGAGATSATRAGQMARGLLAGGTFGAAEGAVRGYGEGATPTERMTEAGKGAGIGAIAGGALGVAAPLATEAAANVIGLFRRSDVAQIATAFGISKDAAKVIKNTFDQGGDMQAAMANLQRAGQEGMLADAGPAAQALLDATSASGVGGGGGVVRGAIDERMSRTNAAVESTLDTVLGPQPQGPRSAVEAIAAKSQPQRAAAYDAAYATPINYADPKGRAVEDVLGRLEPGILKSAIDKANADMVWAGTPNQQIMASIGPDGRVAFQEMPNVQQLDALKRKLQEIAYSDANTDKFGRLTADGRKYAEQAAVLRDAIGEAVDPYKTAVALGGDKIAEERAFSYGADLLKPQTNVEDILFELGRNPSADQIAAAKSGLRGYIGKTLGDIRTIASDPTASSIEARQVVKAVTDMSSPNARTKIRNLLGAEADALFAQIDSAAQSAVVRAAMAQNSKTAARLATQKTVEEITAPGIVGQALQGEPVNTTKALIQAATGRGPEYTAAQRQRIYGDIARALTEKRGPDAAVALRALDAAMSGQAMTDAQTTALARVIAGLVSGGGARYTGEQIKSEYGR